MTSIFARFGPLLLLDEEQLTTDQRASLDYFDAFVDDMDGMRIASAAHRWSRAAREIARFSREQSRLPQAGDPGVKARHVKWMAVQRTADLNSFQQARLNLIPGWAA
ncbi:hypothetical protein [Microbacterium sp. P04]|uniref:hypothetical protein n=1 Tax=Microbacterium sp. P04 TaxID=3366947 RepID=UPI003744BAC2